MYGQMVNGALRFSPASQYCGEEQFRVVYKSPPLVDYQHKTVSAWVVDEENKVITQSYEVVEKTNSELISSERLEDRLLNMFLDVQIENSILAHKIKVLQEAVNNT